MVSCAREEIRSDEEAGRRLSTLRRGVPTRQHEEGNTVVKSESKQGTWAWGIGYDDDTALAHPFSHADSICSQTALH